MSKITKISQAGIDLIKSFESFRAEPYPDPGTGNLPITIGYGSTYYEDGTRVKLTDPPITEARATELLMNVLTAYEKAVDSFCRDDLNQNQFDALVSFAYNIGITALKNSTLLQLVNINPADPKIRKQFRLWHKSGGRSLKGLIRRRDAEADLYFKV